ncbi:hypothetical protein BFX18_09640 [Vibrio cholerae]|uniref:hypothetical protein n=1 Tax=Vibrio cholerae TaxID=666 RepID=UPI0002BC6BF5|nr:hypothetical protein [Vibrio cholerae]EMP85035.1 hypothetical protein VC116063_002365 [Vibrio cholerae O1 str. 116063]OFI85123.1 hypothetical protein BFX18_09640 [Vibrio cholerae]OFJ15306.1 hypothetical protein BFX28_09885 [Vibrio cholerae]OFJ19240.1 hypothetical protein BFX29_09735 [Vibrio cholerae]HAS5639178.1 hypothetical protein [Vibrio cholerae]
MRELNIEIKDSALDEAFRKAPDTLNHYLKQGVSTAGSLVARVAREEAPKAESTLTHTIRSQVVGELQRMITSSLRYNGLVVQETGGQGVPPVQSILDWVRVKRIQPKTPKADQRDLAFMIARSIARKGTPANDFYDRAAEQTQDTVHRILQRSVEEGLRAAGFR